MRRRALAAAAFTTAAVTTALTACGGAAPPPAVVTQTVTVPAPPPPPAPAPASAPAALSAAAPVAAVPAGVPAGSWTMPDLVGTRLQGAQDAIQRLTGYGIVVTTSHDASGADRMQVSDRNWKVCTQSVPAGATITPATRIDFGAVKLNENC